MYILIQFIEPEHYDEPLFPMFIGLFSTYEKAEKAIPENFSKFGENYVKEEENFLIRVGQYIILPIQIDKMVNLTDCIKRINKDKYFANDVIDINKWNNNFN